MSNFEKSNFKKILLINNEFSFNNNALFELLVDIKVRIFFDRDNRFLKDDRRTDYITYEQISKILELPIYKKEFK